MQSPGNAERSRVDLPPGAAQRSSAVRGLMADVCVMHLPQHLVKKHRCGFLYVVATGMEQGVEREVGTLLQIVAVATPGYGLAVLDRQLLPGVQPDADRRVFFKRSQVSFEALVAHQQACLCCKVGWQLCHCVAKLRKIANNTKQMS